MSPSNFLLYAMVWMLLLGVLPAVLGILLVFFARRRGLGHAACGKCGYNVEASIACGPRCPECGLSFAEVGILPPKGTGSRKTGMMIVGVLLIVGGVGWLGMWCVHLLTR